MLDDLKNLRAKYDGLYQNLLKNGEKAHKVKDIRIAVGKSRAVLDIVEMLDRMIASVDLEDDVSEATEEALKQVRIHAVEAKERPVRDSFTAGICLGYCLGYDLIIRDLDTPGGISDLIQEDARQQGAFPIIPETLQLLPPFVAALVNDYTNHDEAQRWSLHDIRYDVESLDVLPIDEDSTCEIWTHAWVWRGKNGTISLSPHIVEPQIAELEDAFAWVVERENTDNEHVRVWRIRYQEPELPDISVPTHAVAAVEPQLLSKQDVFALARTFQQQEKLLLVVRMVEMAYGQKCQAARVILQGGDDPLDGGIHYRHLDSLTVLDHDGNELSPDFGLPFWQNSSDLDLILARIGDEHYSNAVDGYDDPADGTPAYRLAAAIDELIQKEYGPLEAEVRYEINLESEENQMLLHLPFPQLFGHITLPSSTNIDPMR